MKKVTLIFVLLMSSMAFASKKENAQVLDFEAMDVKTSKGSPKGAFVSSKKDKNFGYFFEAKMDFKAKVIESLETVR